MQYKWGDYVYTESMVTGKKTGIAGRIRRENRVLKTEAENLILVHCKGDSVYIFLFCELRGLSPNFYIHVSVSDLYIPRIGPHISSSRNGSSFVGTYNSLTDTWMWKLGLRARYSISGNICFEFLAFFLCSVYLQENKRHAKNPPKSTCKKTVKKTTHVQKKENSSMACLRRKKLCCHPFLLPFLFVFYFSSVVFVKFLFLLLLLRGTGRLHVSV
jgi:hypothetical protein